jgi:chorismate mutase
MINNEKHRKRKTQTRKRIDRKKKKKKKKIENPKHFAVLRNSTQDKQAFVVATYFKALNKAVLGSVNERRHVLDEVAGLRAQAHALLHLVLIREDKKETRHDRILVRAGVDVAVILVLARNHFQQDHARELAVLHAVDVVLLARPG